MGLEQTSLFVFEDLCPYESANRKDGQRLNRDEDCTKCWRESCIEYIKENAPRIGFEVGDDVLFVSTDGPIELGDIGKVVKVERCGESCWVKWPRYPSTTIEGAGLGYSYRVRRVSHLEPPVEKFRFGDVVKGHLAGGQTGNLY